MCGGGGSGDGGAAAAEAKRQAAIKAGYAQIQKIFDGSNVGSGPTVAAPAVGQSYYLADGTPVVYQAVTTNTGESGLANYAGMTPQEIRAARQADTAGWLARRRVAINHGRNDSGGDISSVGGSSGVPTTSYHLFSNGKDLGVAGQPLYGQVTHNGGFDDAFYNDRATAYDNFAMPQLEDQYSKAQDQLIYALARTGRLDSSTRGDKFANLARDYDLQKTNVIDKGVQYADQARQQVENARADLVSLNNATADPNAIAAQAALSASAMRSMPAFDPMAPLFQNVTDGLATEADLERRNMARYNTGFFAPSLSSGSGRTVRY